MDNIEMLSRLDMVNKLLIGEFNTAWNRLNFAKNAYNFEYNVSYNKIVGIDFDNQEFMELQTGFCIMIILKLHIQLMLGLEQMILWHRTGRYWNEN